MLKDKCVVKKNINLGMHIHYIHIYFMECPINSRKNSINK